MFFWNEKLVENEDHKDTLNTSQILDSYFTWKASLVCKNLLYYTINHEFKVVQSICSFVSGFGYNFKISNQDFLWTYFPVIF